MNAVEEFSKLVLVILAAILLLQIITKGNGTGWITSKFSVVGSSPAIPTGNITTTAGGQGQSGFVTPTGGATGGAGGGVGGGGGGSF